MLAWILTILLATQLVLIALGPAFARYEGKSTYKAAWKALLLLFVFFGGYCLCVWLLDTHVKPSFQSDVWYSTGLRFYASWAFVITGFIEVILGFMRASARRTN